MTNKDLPCAVVRDLLPSYLEQLTEPETTALIAEHLTQCPQCTALRDALAPDAAPEPEQQPQVDYLRTLRRKGLHRVLLAIVCTAAVLALAVGAKLFLIGSPLIPQDLGDIAYSPQFRTASDGSAWMDLSLNQSSSGNCFAGLRTRTQDGVLYLQGRKVLPSVLNRSGTAQVAIPLEDLHQIQAFGAPIWQDGMFISTHTNRMFQAATPYVGSAWRVAQTAATLPLPERAFTLELQTQSEPYGLTLHFSEPLMLADQARMQQSAPLLLALVGNLGQVTWTSPDLDGGQRSSTLLLADFNAALPQLTQQYNALHSTQWAAPASVKDYAQSPAQLQQLADLVQLIELPAQPAA